MKFFLCLLLAFMALAGTAQYIGVRARYTATRLIDDSPNPPKRENRLVLSFFEVNASGEFSPITLSNFDLWINKQGLQFGNVLGGVLDSAGNNYPGYAWTAPKVVSYYNSLGPNYIDCSATEATHYVVNGHELDCGFVPVSYWDIDYGTLEPIERFPAPNVCLPWYDFPHPYFFAPGNVNFGPELTPGPPYNLYYFDCGGPQQFVRRGLLSSDSSGGGVVLPVRFAFVQGELRDSNAVIEWSNLTETDIAAYTVERSANGSEWQVAGTVIPIKNDGNLADYRFQTVQSAYQSYYRIQAIELSGDRFYSSILLLRKPPAAPGAPAATPVLSVYPNPVTGPEISFRLSNAPKGRYISSIISPGGQRLKMKMTEHDGMGDLVRQVDVNGLLPGVYRLVLHSTSEKYSSSFYYSR